MIDLETSIRRLSLNAEAIRGMLEGVGDEQAQWRPGPDKWSMLEVINHLIDEERADFRTRLDLLLHHPERPWPAIDPVGWARDRGYNGRAMAESLDNFQCERRASLEWLRGLETPDWDLQHEHPSLGSIAAGSLLLAWQAHDLLHLRQLARLHWQYLNQMGKPYSVAYAGALT